MNALALHFPERRGLARWALPRLQSGSRMPRSLQRSRGGMRKSVPPDVVVPAIVVTLRRSKAVRPQERDVAVGPTMQQAEAAPKEPPKVEEKPMDEVAQQPSPSQEAEVTLPRVERKRVEKPKPEERPPAPETRAPQKTEHVGQFIQAGSDAYNALVFGHSTI